MRAGSLMRSISKNAETCPELADWIRDTDGAIVGPRGAVRCRVAVGFWLDPGC